MRTSMKVKTIKNFHMKSAQFIVMPVSRFTSFYVDVAMHFFYVLPHLKCENFNKKIKLLLYSQNYAEACSVTRRSPSPRLSSWAAHVAGGEPLAILCRFDRPGNYSKPQTSSCT